MQGQDISNCKQEETIFMVIAIERNYKGCVVLYETETKEILALEKHDFDLLEYYGVFPKGLLESASYFKADNKYYSINYNTYFMQNKELYEKYPARHGTGDLLLDIISTMGENKTQAKLELDIKSTLTSLRINLDTPRPSKEDYKKLRVKVPKDKELTWKELEEYEGYIGAYLLVKNLRTRKLYMLPSGVSLNVDNTYLNREFVEGTYKVEGTKVIFDDGLETSVAELAISVLDTPYYPLGAYRVANILANTGINHEMLVLNQGDYIEYPPHFNYTVLNNNGYIRVQGNKEVQDTVYRIQPNLPTDKEIFCTTTPFTIGDLPPRIPTGNKQKQGYYLDPPSIKTGIGLYTYLGITRIGVTEKGYDIRVLCYSGSTDLGIRRNKTLYSIPLICSGLVGYESNEGYVISLEFQTITLSKSVYENLVCVGNGEVLYALLNK